MKPVAVLTLVLSVGLLSGADDKKPDAPKILGTYKLAYGKKDGKFVDDRAKKAKYIIDNKKITVASEDGKYVFGYKLDGTKIDMEILEAPVEALKGTKGYGIIEMKGETLKLAYSTDLEKRPKGFEGKEGFYFELKVTKEKMKD